MSKRRVSFCLTPLVHLYKQVNHVIHIERNYPTIIHQEPEKKNSIVDPIGEVGHDFPLPKLNLSNCSSCTESESKTPRLYSDFDEYDCYTPLEKIPKYDQSPLSPRAFLEINSLREQEGILRTHALTMAIFEFQQYATPSPSPLSMSPLSLSPKPQLLTAAAIPLPLSPENSSNSLNTMN